MSSLNGNPNNVQDDSLNPWKILFAISSSFALQQNRESWLDTMGRAFLREAGFQAFHYHWIEGETAKPSRNWIFEKNDVNIVLTSEINHGLSDLKNLFGAALHTLVQGALRPLQQAYAPYKYCLFVPIQAEGRLVAVLEWFSSRSDLNITLPPTFFLNLQNELNRQLEMNLNQERERDQVVELAQASRLSSLGAMAGGIAHEINNPLTIIMGMLKMTIKEINNTNTPVNREKITTVLEKARLYTERIGKIVKGIRALSRDSSRDPFIMSRVQDIIDSTFALCEAAIKTNNIQFSYDLEDPELMIQCRPVQISQVLLNLVNNSMDAVGDQPTPWIHVAVRKFNNETIEFSVTDSGPGIPESIANRLMQPFFTTKGAGKGTGLGLSISKEIIKSHSGQFTLDREFPNTRFLIHIPVEQNLQKLQAS